MFQHQYSPNNVNEMFFNKDKISIINRLKINGIHQNILISGENGSGKYTFIKILLNNLFGNINLKNISYELTKFILYYKFNNSFIVIDFKFYINKEKYIVEEFIKFYISSKNVFYNQEKIIVIKNFNNITEKIQIGISRLIDKYNHNVKFIILTSTKKI